LNTVHYAIGLGSTGGIQPRKRALKDASTIISIEKLVFGYLENKPVLKGIDLEVKEGEYIAIMGANGVGKTTLCLHMNGILPVVLGGEFGGSILVAGKAPNENPVYNNALDVGMVLQDPDAQLFSTTVETEVAFAAENHGVPRDEIIKQIDWSLGVVRLSEYKDSTPSDLSGGQKQRLAIASNLVIRPKIMVLDEPTSQLDPLGNSEVFATLRDLNEEFGMTILVATHMSDEIVHFADRIVVLNDGKVVSNDFPAKVFRHVPVLKKAYVPIPELAELDYQLRELAGERAQVYGEDQSANTELDEEVAAIRKGIQEGLVRPNRNFRKGLGRSVSEELVAEDAETVLEIKNVDFRYYEDDPLALEDVNLSVRKGEVVGIIGQNGAGKTTLMKCITGILTPSRGSIRILGTDLAQMDAIGVAKRVGLILQHPDNQLFEMSAAEEIGFALKNLKLEESEIQHRVDETLKLVGLEGERETYPFNLGMADRRKLAVAAIYAMHPEILIFDEPTTGQDYRGRYQLCDLALRLHKLGTTILMISHDMTLIARYTKRTVVMGKAKILLDAATREVFSGKNRAILESTFLSPPPIARLAQSLQGDGVPQDVLTVEEALNALTGEVVENIVQVW